MVTPERVRVLLHYEPFTGELTWKVSRCGVKVGDAAGSRTKTGRLTITVDNKWYHASRIIWLWVTGSWPVGVVDHRDRNPANNRWKNLRDVTQGVNRLNSSLRSDNVTGVAGVGWHKVGKKWQARIRRKSLGLFVSFDEAVAVRQKAEQENADKS